MERWITKTLAALIIFVVIVFFTALPVLLSGWFRRKGERGQTIMSLCRCFGGGAFLGAFLLHALPEADVVIHDSLLEPYDIHYHIPELLTGLGFFLMMFLEKFILMCMVGGDKKEKQDNYDVVAYSRKVDVTDEQQDGTTSQQVNSGSNSVSCQLEVKTAHVKAGEGSKEYKEKDGDLENHVTPQQQHHGHSHAPPMSDKHQSTLGFAKSVMLLIALSVDCLFEGMSLGLQESNRGVWNMAIAILSHEFIIGFTLGLELLKNNPRTRVLGLSVFYGLTTPIGITVGALITELGDDVDQLDIVSGFLQAITAGVFLYVTFFEILVDEVGPSTPLSYLLTVFVGFALMASLSFIPHDDDHDDHPERLLTTMETLTVS